MKKFIKTEFGESLNGFFPKVAALETGEFLLAKTIDFVPGEYLYILEPEAEITEETLLSSETRFGTLIMKAEPSAETYLLLLGQSPIDGNEILVDDMGGLVLSAINVVFEEDIQEVDLGLITFVGTTTGAIPFTPSITGAELDIDVPGALVDGETVTLTIPVGAISGDPSGNILEEEIVISWPVATGGLG